MRQKHVPKTKKYADVEVFFKNRNWQPFKYQKQVWRHFLEGKSGIVNAPTGSGKTYSVWAAIVQHLINKSRTKTGLKRGLKAIWISPLRALTEEIYSATEKFCEEIDFEIEIGIRTGDTEQKIKQKQMRQMPDLLITTPETLHLLLASKKSDIIFNNLEAVTVDEWHELLGSKRGILVELALSRLKAVRNKLRIWGISATIGNLKEAMDVLLGVNFPEKKKQLVRSNLEKKYLVESLMPNDVEKFPWSGHLGIQMINNVVEIIKKHKSTLIFTNTRAQCEIWFQQILEKNPEFAGILAMHHGSIAKKTRNWVEQALHEKRLQAVVCTSSLDLGVDFRPVDAVIQVGSPKGIARFMQRAGRAGHRPGESSKIYFVPTNSLELIEAAGLREAIEKNEIESRNPYVRSFDILAQYLVTLAVGGGFYPEKIYMEVKTTFSYESMNYDEWKEILNFIANGGNTLENYDEYKKIEVDEVGRCYVASKRIAMRHRMSIGAIVSDAMLNVKFIGGSRIGMVEEWFISKLETGDIFWFSGRSLEFIKIKDMTVLVKRSKEKTGIVPAWMGGRMSLSSNMSEMLRKKLEEASTKKSNEPELQKIIPLLEKQEQVSYLPKKNELLIEKTKSREGYHVFVFPYEGRYVHEGMASLLAWRISQLQPISFSIAFNDYGFELLSKDEIPIEIAIDSNFLTDDHLQQDLLESINSAELAKRRFRDISAIAGLIFQGFPGNTKQDKHLQSSAGLLFDVISKYEPDSFLIRQAYEEVFLYTIQEPRLKQVLKRIKNNKVIIKETKKPSPFAFPILVDRLREKLSSENLSDRVKKMQLQFDR